MRTSLLLVGFLLAGMRPVPVSASVTPNGNQLWHLDVPLVNEVAVADDHFGAALATGDFDDDGFDDLAIGIPRRDFLFGVDNIGAVLILYGTSQGLATAGQQVLTQGGAEIEDGDRFGGVLASGDFDGDGYDDLAVGVPLEDLPGGGGDLVNAGVVTVFYCSSGGLGSPEMWHQNVSGVPGAVEEFDLFGASLAVADFDRDGYDELVIGSPGDDVGGLPEAGLVIVLPGTASGLTGMGSQRFRQGFDGIADTAEFRDRFGQTRHLAVPPAGYLRHPRSPGAG